MCEMDLDEDIKEILKDFNHWKEVVAKANKNQKNQELIINSLKSKSKFFNDEINYLKNQNAKKDRQIEEYNKILSHYNETDDKYTELIKQSETKDAEIKKLKIQFLNEKNAWNLEKKGLQKTSDFEQEKNNIEKQVEKLKKELETSKNEHKSRLDYERQQHQNELDYYKRIYEEKLANLNEDLAAYQIEATSLKVSGARITKIPKVENKFQTTPTYSVTIQSVTSSSDIPFPEQRPASIQRINRVKFPVDKKRKLFNLQETIEID